MTWAAGVNVAALAATGHVPPASCGSKVNERSTPGRGDVTCARRPSYEGVTRTVDEQEAVPGPVSGELLDMMTTAFRAIDEARAHAYSQTAAMQAAAEVLLPLDRGNLLLVSTMLAALVASDLAPADREPLSCWSERYQFALSMRERPA